MLLINTFKIIDWTLDIFLLNLKLVTSSRITLTSEYISPIFFHYHYWIQVLAKSVKPWEVMKLTVGQGQGGLNLELSLILDWMPYQG